MDGNMFLERVDKRAPALTDLGFVSSLYAMYEFGDSYRRDRDFDLTEVLSDFYQKVRNRLPVAFCSNDYAGIKD
jgi:hypothetical protein